jgi:hypothetical protein
LFRILELQYEIKKVPAGDEYKATLEQFTQAAREQLQAVVTGMQQDVAGRFAGLTSPVSAQLGPVGDVVSAANVSIAAAANTVEEMLRQVDANTRIEELGLATSRLATTDRVATTLTSLVAAVTADAADTFRVMTEDDAYTASILTSMSQQVASFSVAENARASTKAASLDGLASTTPAQLSSALSTAVSAQVARDNAQASTSVSSMAVLAIGAKDGSTDSSTW